MMRSIPEPVLPDGSWAGTAARRRIMQGNRSRDTKPELLVRRTLHASGLRYRTDARPVASLRCRADIVFTRAMIAVFIDGCFWHGCPEHYREPQRNSEYWVPKIQGNRERDTRSTSALEGSGWLVLRYWEHQSHESIAQDIRLRYSFRMRAVNASKGATLTPTCDSKPSAVEHSFVVSQ